MQELDDIDTKFKLVTAGQPVVLLDDLGPGTRRPQRSSAYSLLKQVGHAPCPLMGLSFGLLQCCWFVCMLWGWQCLTSWFATERQSPDNAVLCQAGLDEVVSAMAMSAVDFGDNLLRSLKLKQPQDSRTMPMDLAYGLVRKVTSQQVSCGCPTGSCGCNCILVPLPPCNTATNAVSVTRIPHLTSLKKSWTGRVRFTWQGLWLSPMYGPSFAATSVRTCVSRQVCGFTPETLATYGSLLTSMGQAPQARA